MDQAVYVAFNQRIHGGATACNAILLLRLLNRLSLKESLSSSKQFLSADNRFYLEAITMKPSEPTMNRRDWFRLRSPNLVNQLPNSPRLQPIDLPPNNDGMDLKELQSIVEDPIGVGVWIHNTLFPKLVPSRPAIMMLLLAFGILKRKPKA